MTTTTFLWDKANDTYLWESDDDGTKTVYTTEPFLIGNITSMRTATGTRYYQFDGHGSTRHLTNESQTITDSYVYSTFGAVIVSTGATTNPFGYKGALSYYKDTLSGDLYVRSRTYRPTLGRWLSIDPLAPSVHDLYRYTYNAPLMFSDASGLVPEKDDSDNKEEMEKCSQEEQDWWFIEEACDCIWYRVTQERFEEHSGAGWIASVTCENDQMVIMYNTDPTITKLLEEYKKCGFDKCVARHESHHIAQCNLTNSMVCKGVQPPEPGYVVYVTVTPNCTKKAECFAYLTEARCALDIFKKLQMDGRTECMEIARKFIGRVEGQLRHFECHVSDDLKKELSDAWDQANEGSKMK